MVKLRFPPVVLLLALGAGSFLSAQVVAPSGRTLFNRGVMVRCLSRVDFFHSQGGRDLTRASFPCALNWGVLPDTSLIAVFPGVMSRRQEVDGAGRHLQDTDFGRGDALLLIQYDGLYRKTVPRGFTRFGLQGGLQLPSGSSGLSARAPRFLVAGIFSHIRDRHWFIADVRADWASRDGDSGFRAGHLYGFDLAYLYRLLPWRGFRGDNLFLLVELNGQDVGRTRLGQSPLEDSGGGSLTLSPGLEYLPSRRLVLEFALPVPVYHSLHGNQLEPQISAVGGVRILF